IIKNPVTGLPVARGPNATGLSLGYAGAKYRFTGFNSPTTSTSEYQQSEAIFLWLQNNVLPNNQDDKALLLNALGNLWPAGDFTDTTTLTFNAQTIGPRSFTQSYEYIPLLHQVLFNQPNFILSAVPASHPYFNNTNAYFSALIDSAPTQGLYNYGNGNYFNFHWSSTSRNVHPERRGDFFPDFPGHYNGLDYMLIYNLHRLSVNLASDIAEINTNTFSIHPNPCSSELTITIPPDQKVKIEIYNLEGKSVAKAENIYGIFKLNCLNFLPGLYIIKISGTNLIEVKKLIIR
ncbi:MAG: T9SS type A sorting domain-containing protein, partial [Nitrosopumilus sp.]|nr:T9SS type A sorting domain-containing protein [Nitrosopumilus sp.]